MVDFGQKLTSSDCSVCTGTCGTGYCEYEAALIQSVSVGWWLSDQRQKKISMDKMRREKNNTPEQLAFPSDARGVLLPTPTPVESGSEVPSSPFPPASGVSDNGCKGGPRMVKPSARLSSTARIFAIFVFWVNLPIDLTGHLLWCGMTRSCNSPFDLLSLCEYNLSKRRAPNQGPLYSQVGRLD
jgi:hypothetical protein